MVNKKQIFNKICKDIKSIKIQGATNVAKQGFRAYKLFPTQTSKKKLLSLRPTEPMLFNLITKHKDKTYSQISEEIKQAQDTINKETYKLIKNNSVIFTHCHSSSVTKALAYAKEKGKNFEVYHTETRPLFQGRKTARDLKKAKIKATMFPDSGAQIALTKSQDTKKANLVLLGADAILKEGVINKIGSGMFSGIAKKNKIPVYILSNSLKYYPKKIKIEERGFDEVWDTEKKIKIKNPAFELIKRKQIKGIISDLGNLSYSQFLTRVKN
jgi:translation initiation factor 2B subunit (eIF-2B alpha/beta/delta family)